MSIALTESAEHYYPTLLTVLYICKVRCSVEMWAYVMGVSMGLEGVWEL
jgi:hypothetical protein